MKDEARSKWQYSLKTYLLVMALVAVVIGWCCDRWRLQAQLNDAQRRIQLLETSPYFDSLPNLQMQMPEAPR